MVPTVSNKQKNIFLKLKNKCFVGILKPTDEKSRSVIQCTDPEHWQKGSKAQKLL
jgi:hypothetical protein